MTSYEKIRILWIHDTDDEPGITLPDEYDQYFSVVTKLNDGKTFFVDSMGIFKPILERFWFEKDNDQLPVEIMAVDYDLSKRRSKQLGRDRGIFSRDAYVEAQTSDQGQKAEALFQGESLDFDGLLLGLFYASLTYRHPVGFVPTTHRYTDLCRVTASVPELQALSERILGIHFDHVNKAMHRSWGNIINAGVASLRERMKVLCERKWCAFALNDLKALIENQDHQILRFYSPYSERSLPVQGLFVDKADDKERNNYIRDWAKTMIDQLSSFDELDEAENLAERLWEKYDDTQLVSQREALSQAIANGVETLPKKLEELFRPTSGPKAMCKQNCLDIRSERHSDSVRRQAALDIILRLLKRCIKARKAVAKITTSENKMTSIMLSPDKPAINAEDVYLALFPVPKDPLVLPWHSGNNIDKSHGWGSSLMEWNSGNKAQRRKGDLAFSVQDVLDGKDWDLDNNTFGLMPGERHILRCKALADNEISVDDWKSYYVANRILRWEEMMR